MMSHNRYIREWPLAVAVLTLAGLVIGMSLVLEMLDRPVALITLLAGEAKATLARDTMYAVVMLVIKGRSRCPRRWMRWSAGSGLRSR
jgi:hypothetical protein